MDNENQTITILFGNKSGAGKSWCAWVLANSLIYKGAKKEEILVTSCDEFTGTSKVMDYVTYNFENLIDPETKLISEYVLSDYILHLTEQPYKHIILDLGLTAIKMFPFFLRRSAIRTLLTDLTTEDNIRINIAGCVGWTGDKEVYTVLADNANELLREVPEGCDRVILYNTHKRTRQDIDEDVRELADATNASIQEIRLFDETLESATSTQCANLFDTFAKYDTGKYATSYFEEQFDEMNLIF